mmetsp:Transcript_11804/g.21879  ORF Transcript_11804/g.21879 Transcript_11804/m.21879 type:complete len:365 (+) Transcript_11804:185-1279(+)
MLSTARNAGAAGGLTRQAARALSSSAPAPPTDWKALGFGYVPTKSNVRYNFDWNNGWDKGELSSDEYVNIHLLSNVIHYGQSIFEGLKAFHLKDGSVTAFNPKANAQRMRNGAARLGMPEVPEELFLEGISRVVADNVDYVPPYGSDGSFYLRPFLTGHGPQLGLGVAENFLFGVVGTPAGNYYKAGINPINAQIINYSRAAPRGVGNVKCAGNYAADVKPAADAKKAGFEIALYLDAKESKYIEEFSTSNMIAISKDKKTLITPKSESILPSTTNIMLQQLAEDRGMKVERRPVEFDELKTFGEVGACGTAVIISPIGSVTRDGERTEFDNFDTLLSLYKELRDIQTGEAEDKHGWHYKITSK